LRTVPFPFNIAAAAAGAVTVKRLLQKAVPKFQTGGVTPGGIVSVGEGGRELVDLPAGSRVFNANETREIEQGGGDTIILDQRNSIIGKGAVEEFDERLDQLASIGRSKVAKRLSGAG